MGFCAFTRSRIATPSTGWIGSLWVLLLLVLVVPQAAAQDVPQAAEGATAETTTAAVFEPERSSRINFREAFQSGLHSFEASAGGVVQHEMPSGPRSDFDGERLSVAWRRFTEPRVEKGLELSFSALDGIVSDTQAWELVYARRQYFRVRPRYALNWSVGAGLCHLTELCADTGAHTNFVEQVGVGVMRRTGARSALVLEYRFSHISNAGRREPNVGINSSVFALGWRIHY